jgi:arsenite/tail-anchored protein-transporting ATPase
LAGGYKAFATARLFLVTTPERFALNESVRCLRELRESSSNLHVEAIVLNRVVLEARGCANCRARAKSVRAARIRLRKEFSSAELYVAEDPGGAILGIDRLRKFGSHVFDGKPLKWTPASRRVPKKANFAFTPTAWPSLKAPLSFVLGKGGVGKTTVSAALAYRWRSHSPEAVEVCSVDPAPSLDDIFETAVGDRPVSVLGDAKFHASELDSLALFRGWIEEIRTEVESATTAEYSGVHVDLSYERALFSELLEFVPPGLDEVLAIFRIIELLGGPFEKLIVDMAPTGHALELLRMPERILVWARLLLKSLAAHRKLALARKAAVKIAELEVRARELSQALRSSRQVQIFVVMLAEPLPDRENERLLDELRGLHLSAGTIFVNRVLMPQDVGQCGRCLQTFERQTAILAELKQRFRGKVLYAIRNFDHDIAGRRGLRELTGELWRLN